MEYAQISVSKQTKERFLSHGPLKVDTQENIMIKILDCYEQAEAMKVFWDKYHPYEEQISGILGD